MRPMNEAPKDGRTIEVKSGGRWWRVEYQDCQWMRDDPNCDDVPDAWLIEGLKGPGHIELDEAEGWREAADEQF